MLKAVWVPMRQRVRCAGVSLAARGWCGRTAEERGARGARPVLLGRPPESDLSGKQGRVWLTEQQLPEEEAETVASCLRHIDFLGGEIRVADAQAYERCVIAV